MKKIRTLFICIHNSARSQMAEAFLKKYGGDKYFVESAGLEAGTLNPLVVKVMKEEGLDISNNKTKSVFDFYKQGKTYDFVITVCDKEAAERCPIFPGNATRLHWGFNDPPREDNEKDAMEKVRKIRDEIKQKIIKFIDIT